MMQSLQTLMIFIQVLNTNGLRPYFHIETTLMDYDDSVKFCKSIGMDLIKIDNPEINSMAVDYLKNEVAGKALISLKCPSLTCSWPNGEPLLWSSWKSTDQPQYECVLFDDLPLSIWITGKCEDAYYPLCYAPPIPGSEFMTGGFDFYEASEHCHNIGGQLAVLNNPVVTLKAKQLIGFTQSTDIWIGLYGNGTNLVWQNPKADLAYTDWMITDTAIPEDTSDIAVVMDSALFTWKLAQKTDRLSHLICHYNYLPVNLPTSYDDARDECKKSALELAILSTNEEFILAKDAIAHQGVTNVDFWIGLTSNGIEFKWNDGTPLSFSSWVPAAPSANIDFWYVEMDHSQNYNWNNRPETENNGYLCKFPTDNKYPITVTTEDMQALSTTATTEQTPDIIFAGKTRLQHFRIDKVNYVPDISPFAVKQVNSSIECADMCLKVKNMCSAFSMKNMKCCLYNGYSSSDVTGNFDSIIWI